MRLLREIRCFPTSTPEKGAPVNAWADVPRSPGREAFWVVRAVAEGAVDEKTGYLCDLKEIDALLRGVVVPKLQEGTEAPPAERRGMEASLAGSLAALSGCDLRPARVVSLELTVSPYLFYTVDIGDPSMVCVTQSFEFSASHRLFCESLGEEENRRIFGKCSNPHGHGHNYVLEITIKGRPDDRTGTIVDLPLLNRVVRERVIDPFDHRNLNVECDEFKSLNPSVENIARVIWRRLDGAFARCRLAKVRVWETPKTCAEYCGGE